MNRFLVAAEPINRFPGCVYLKLYGDFCDDDSKKTATHLFPIPRKVDRSKKYQEETINLRLSIRFGVESVKVAGGSIWFGLKIGELRLKLVNAAIPIEKQGLIAPFQNEVILEVQHDKGSEVEGSTSVSTIAGLTAKAKDVTKKSEKISYKSYSVYTGGTEKDPLWIFEANLHKPILKGQISNVPIGSATLFSDSCSIVATFQVRGQHDIYFTEAEGLWDKDIGRNKLAILEREIFLRFIAPRLKPHLSHSQIVDGQR